jgi:hypothetical protein
MLSLNQYLWIKGKRVCVFFHDKYVVVTADKASHGIVCENYYNGCLIKEHTISKDFTNPLTTCFVKDDFLSK